jgi:mannose-6-phosphate isomerase-like protein (cupin superfamily)
MGFTQLIGRTELSTNFLYLHTGSINAKSGIGQHFHHGIEEMFVILDGEAEFTINGRTSKIVGPALVPCKMGNSHGIYNTSNKPIRWMNFAVSNIKGTADNFDLGDDRVGAKLDPIPQFVSGLLKKDLLRPNTTAYSGNGNLYRRILGPAIFSTNWDHVDHVVIPAGGKAGPRQLEGIEEVYYVINGSGLLSMGSESASIGKDDAFYGLLGEKLSLSNTGKDDLELLVIGIAASRQQKDPTQLRALAKPKAMVLQMDFVVTKENSEAFEKMYHSIYVPAMTVQKGYLESKLLRMYPDDLAKKIQAEPSTFNYQIQISFDTEENRMKWVASPQHQIAWPAATSLAKEYKWRGYDVMGDDNNQ